MKNLPQSISIFKINEKEQTIRYEEMYRDEVRWEKEDIFKCLIFIFSFSIIPFLALGIESHIFILRCLGYIFSGLTVLSIIGFAIAETVIEDKLWEKQVMETCTIDYQWHKAIYQISRAELRTKLDSIRKKENTSIAEQEFYEKYKELYDHEYVEYLDIPLWYVLS